MKRRSLLLSAPVLLPGCAVLESPVPQVRVASDLMAPALPREFRAAWVATVANIDWPSRKGLDRETQLAEIRATVRQARDLGLNALILQVRTSADALYASRREPWSEYLTGTQGGDPGYDPLAVWIEQAHAAGLELHAWFNPYRARQSGAQSAQAPDHLSQTQPQWVKRYGKQLWIDPGEPGAVAHTLAVFRDVLSRYAVDGVHIDDYFYPYPEKDANGQEVDFPDEASFATYGGGLEKADWRRRNVNQLVENLFHLIREVRPTARLGISPFGLMKPSERPPGIQGFSQYDKLYADVELWLAKGWLDYLVPQLYWPRAQTAQAFGPLLQGWMRLNPLGRPIWPGLYTSRITEGPAGAELQSAGDTRGWMPDEVAGQIALTRAAVPDGGHVHFSWVALKQNRRGIADHLKAKTYTQAAVPPVLPWLSDQPPSALSLERVHDLTGTVRWQLRGAEEGPLRRWLWWREGGQWRGQLQGAGPFEWPESAEALVACALSPTGIEGPRQGWIRW
ncbi:glycoside hydrolase family 10 protein [Inhella gelatinilytica]|uniref:Family 10 glycosylhydrolase n=1 Tax=Inhella gelatinilytica TaxID=2795030 RepID=A0A931IX46_9BURK|nr:family 10 glycosylhydrolase [Inhella gelatinilytica]MBH9552630.1 family 10 glycosylhydrolase [Inhella gelatinilytica]